MKLYKSLLTVTLMLLMLVASGPCFGLSAGQQAPAFKLIDTRGIAFDLFQLKERPMTILYFFDAESPSSQEGLLSLDHLVKRYPDLDMEVLAITLSEQERVVDFVTKSQPGFPVLLDDSGVSDKYHARKILPAIHILGPGLQVLDVIQGGGKATEAMLLRIAERTLQRNKIQLTKTLSEKVNERDPGNLEALTLQAYAAMKAGDLEAAEKIFAELAQRKGQAESRGREGLVMVYARTGQDQKALDLAKQLENVDPERGFIHLARGDVLYRNGKRAEAEVEYRKAVTKKAAVSSQRAVALNQLGRISADRGNYQQARELYDQAVAINPYYVEAMTNKGISYEKEGRWEDALLINQMALGIDEKNSFAAVLAKNAEKMLAMQRDAAEKERIDKLVKELTERFRNPDTSRTEAEDDWTTGPMVMTFIDFQEQGGLVEQAGLATVLTTQLGDLLNSSGRVEVVERGVVDRIFEELKIGSSALADPAAGLTIGRMLAAKLIGTGALYYLPEKTLLTLRLVDTETSAIQKVLTLELRPHSSLDRELFRLNRDILRTVMQNYPLKGFIVENSGEQVLINLGEKQGVVQGTTFAVLADREAKKYHNQVLSGSARAIGHIEIVKVESDLSIARIVNHEMPLKPGLKIREMLILPEAFGEQPVLQ